MNRKEYEWAKRTGREAYERAIRDMDAVGGGGDPITDQHRHPDYALIDHEHDDDGEWVSAVEDTDIKPTTDNLFITLNTRRPKEADGTFTDQEFGLNIDLDEGNTYKNQFQVGTERNGFALKVLGGTGRETWFGGRIAQKGNSLENKDARDYIIRKNLNDAVEPLLEQVETNEDRINALEHELDAIATNKEAGEWEMVSPLDFDVRGTGQMTLASDDFTASNNTLTLHQTDLNGVSHGFSGVEVGDLVEVVQEHKARDTGDYGLYEVTGVNGMSFTLSLQQGRGTADLNTNFFVKFFHLSDNIDLAELDARYSKIGHTHSYAPSSHTHNYASSNHTHSDLGGFVSLSHGKKTWFATNENWNSTTYFFPYYRSSSGSTYYGGRVDQLGMVEFKNGTNFYQKIGKTGTLIGATSSGHPHFPVVVFQVWESDSYSSTSNGTNVQRFYGSVIWARNSQNWNDYDPGIYWYFRGAGR
jgi:hypothetical protein